MNGKPYLGIRSRNRLSENFLIEMTIGFLETVNVNNIGYSDQSRGNIDSLISRTFWLLTEYIS